jgi:hypothetical protein
MTVEVEEGNEVDFSLFHVELCGRWVTRLGERDAIQWGTTTFVRKGDCNKFDKVDLPFSLHPTEFPLTDMSLWELPPSPQTFILKIATAVIVETPEHLQHSTRLTNEIRNYVKIRPRKPKAKIVCTDTKWNHAAVNSVSSSYKNHLEAAV